MKPIGRTPTITVLSAAALMAGAVALTGPPATASPALQVAYTCVGPDYIPGGTQVPIPMTATFTANTPPVEYNDTVQGFGVQTTISFSTDLLQAQQLSPISPITVAATLTSAGGTADDSWSATFPPTLQPGNLAWSATTQGTTPTLSVSKPGAASVTVGDITMRANTSHGPGTVTCFPNAGADTTLANFQVVSDPVPPSPVVHFTVTVSGHDILLSWTPVDDPNGPVTAYLIYVDDKLAATVSGNETSADITSLSSGTHRITMAYEDSTGISPISGPITVTIPPPPPTTQTVSGETFLKAANATLQLGGTAHLSQSPDGSVSGSVTLNPVTGTFKVFGILPATASIGFTPTGTANGTSTTLDLKEVVTVASFKVLGVSIGGGSTCQTASPVDIALTSTGFAPAQGGEYQSAGYTIPALQDCGPLTPLLNYLTSGAGNTMDLKLSPAQE